MPVVEAVKALVFHFRGVVRNTSRSEVLFWDISLNTSEVLCKAIDYCRRQMQGCVGSCLMHIRLAVFYGRLAEGETNQCCPKKYLKV